MTRKLVLAFMMIVMCASCSAAYDTDTHSGDVEDPYIISTVDDLYQLAYNADEGMYYRLSNDIQLAGYSNFPGIGSAIAAPFTGHFDGNGHTIYVNIAPLPGNDDNGYEPITYDRALFGCIDTETDYAVKNLKVEGSVRGYNAGGIISILNAGEITGCSFSGDVIVRTREYDSAIYELIDYMNDDDIQDADAVEMRDYVPGNSMHYGKINAGGIAAVNEAGNITDCSFRGTVIAAANLTPANAGGMAGRMYGGNIKSCDVVGDSVITASTVESGDNVIACAGGIVGTAVTPLDSEIASCTFDGLLSSTYYAGGIGGIIRGTILTGNTVTATAEVSGTFSAGGIAGYMASGGQARNNAAETGLIVSADIYCIGGIIGLLETNKGAVYGNTAYAVLSGSAPYKGGIVGALGNNTKANIAIGTGNSYTGAEYAVGRDEWGQPSNNNNGTGGSNNGSTDGSSVYEISTLTLPYAVVGEPYTASLDTTAPEGIAVTWSYGESLPDGMSADKNGHITWTPATRGKYTFTAGAYIEGYGETESADIDISVLTSIDLLPNAVPILNASLPDGQVGTEYYAELHTNIMGVKWRVSSGDLPANLTLSANSGVISGTPSEDGEFTFVVLALVSGREGMRQFTITIAPEPEAVNVSSGSGGCVSGFGAVSLAVVVYMLRKR